MEVINKKIFVNNNYKNKNVNMNTNNSSADNSFQNLLSEKINNDETLKFSKHANLRLNDRNLNLSPNQLERVKNGVNNARSKGISDSLVLVDDVALVVSVKNNTVITATNKNNTSVFTNINGAVIV